MLHEIWIHPVKSVGGTQVEVADVGPLGLDGDRAWAVVETATDRIASGKHPRRWGALARLRSRPADGGHAVIELDTGDVSTAEPGAAGAALSALLGVDVHLAPAAQASGGSIERTDPDAEALGDDGEIPLGAVTVGRLGAAAPPGTVFDFAPVHVITTATLAALEDLAGPTGGDVRRYRPNLVVDIDVPPFAENGWPGTVLRVGEVSLRAVIPTPRCIVPTLAHRELPSAPAVLRRLATANRIELAGHGWYSCAGVYMTVERGGRVRCGDEVALDGDATTRP